MLSKILGTSFNQGAVLQKLSDINKYLSDNRFTIVLLAMVPQKLKKTEKL
jgi:hypothetical protein